jgi:radial spoke head protein 9
VDEFGLFLTITSVHCSIKFWGRVVGTTADYLVCCATVSTLEKPLRKWYYATTKSLSLQQMPEMTAEFTKLATGIMGRFLGNPAKLLGPDADQPEEDGVDDNGNPLPKKVRFSEAHRLAQVVGTIEHDTGVVPKGAFVVTPTHHIVEDAHYAGLNATEAGSLGSYMHFRPAEHPARAHALYKPGAIAHSDFLDPISEDKPAGCWTLRMDKGKALVEIRSLSWPGYSFFHLAGTARYGAVYVGDGRADHNLHFAM